jgi:hypothetical protein
MKSPWTSDRGISATAARSSPQRSSTSSSRRRIDSRIPVFAAVTTGSNALPRRLQQLWIEVEARQPGRRGDGSRMERCEPLAGEQAVFLDLRRIALVAGVLEEQPRAPVVICDEAVAGKGRHADLRQHLAVEATRDLELACAPALGDHRRPCWAKAVETVDGRRAPLLALENLSRRRSASTSADLLPGVESVVELRSVSKLAAARARTLEAHPIPPATRSCASSHVRSTRA